MAKGRDEEYRQRREGEVGYSKQDAKERGLWRYRGSSPCKNGHSPAIRFTVNGNCQDCYTAAERPTDIGYVKNREEYIASSKFEALQFNVRRYFSEKPCSRGHDPTIRFVANGNCQECGQLHSRQRVERMKTDGSWEKELNLIRENRRTDPTRTRELAMDWCRRFPERVLAKHAIRRAQKRAQIPPWADRKKMVKIYKECRELNNSGSRRYHVDHIVPLNGIDVSGLHTQANLRVLPDFENLSKSNRFDPNDLDQGIDLLAEYYQHGWIPIQG